VQILIDSLGSDGAGRTLLAHRAAVLRLAAELQLRPRQASVNDFLAVLVAKRVWEQLRQGSGNLTTR
jgi:hypothetical protein